jgi:hypothetical protein
LVDRPPLRDWGPSRTRCDSEPEATPAAVLAPSTVRDEDTIHAPDAWRVALEAWLLAKKLTVADAKSLLDADAGTLQRHGKLLPGYSPEARSAAYERVSKAAHPRPKALADRDADKKAVADKRLRRVLAIARGIKKTRSELSLPELSVPEIAQEVARKIRARGWKWTYRLLLKNNFS